MSRQDPYLYEDVPVLKNLPGIKNSEELKIAEGNLSRMSMGIVYARNMTSSTQRLSVISTAPFLAAFMNGRANSVPFQL